MCHTSTCHKFQLTCTLAWRHLQTHHPPAPPNPTKPSVPHPTTPKQSKPKQIHHDRSNLVPPLYISPPPHLVTNTSSNDRLGKKVRVKCDPDDTIGDFKKLVAAQIGTSAEKVCSSLLQGRRRWWVLTDGGGWIQIVLKKWYNTFKDHITLADYEISNGASLEM